MEELQNIEVQNEFLLLPEEIQEDLLQNKDVKSLCEKLIELLSKGNRITIHDLIPLVNLLKIFALHESLFIELKARFIFKAGLFCQNLINIEEAEEMFLIAKEMYSVIEDRKAIQKLNVYLAINCVHLSKFAEAQHYLLSVEDGIDYFPNETDLESIRLLCKFFKAVNYVHLGSSSRKTYIEYTERIYNFFQRYQCNKSWDNELLASYYSLLQSTVDGYILLKKYWFAYTILKELPYVIVHPNTFPRTKEFAQNDLLISEFDLQLRICDVQKNKLEQIINLYTSLDETYFEFFNQKLNITILLCEYYFSVDNYKGAKKWFSRFEKQKKKSKKYFTPEETGYIEFYNSAIQFFSKHGDTSLAQTYTEINTKLHKDALEKADNFRYKEMKLWKQIQKEREQSKQLELQIETVRQQLITQIDSSLTLNQLLNDFSRTIHSSIIDIPEKKQNQLLKQVKKFNDVQQLTQHFNKFESDFSAIYPLFNSNFLQKHPEITKTEMYVCMAVLLNLSNQQIADFFHKEVKTIEEYIRRIRRKLRLEQRANLKAYLLLWTK